MPQIKKVTYIVLLVIAGIVLWNSFSGSSPAGSTWAIDLLRPFAIVYLDSFKSPETAVLASLCLAGICIVNFIWMVFVVFMPVNRAIEKLINLLDSSNFMTSPTDKYSILDSTLKGSFLFKERWNKFKKNLLLNNSSKTALQGDNSPEKYFNLDLIESKGVPLSLLSSLPAYYVGAGLVLTFMGLVASLFFAGSGMKTGDFNEVRNAFIQLINASTFKFMTSIVGISASLILSLTFRISLHKLEAKLTRFCYIIEEEVEEINSASLKIAA